MAQLDLLPVLILTEWFSPAPGTAHECSWYSICPVCATRDLQAHIVKSPIDTQPSGEEVLNSFFFLLTGSLSPLETRWPSVGRNACARRAPSPWPAVSPSRSADQAVSPPRRVPPRLQAHLPGLPCPSFTDHFPSAAWREVGAVPTLEDSWSMTQLADSPDSWASLHTNAGKTGCPTVNRDGLGHVSATWVVLLEWAGLLVSPLVHAAWSTPTELIRCFPPVALNS